MIIALLTDFGTKDYFVGAMKGVILSINSEAKIIDITHEIEAQNIVSAGFTLASCYQDFPPKTIFAAIVDPGVGSKRKAILVETEDYYFIAPDNGLLSFILQNETDYRAFALSNPKFFGQFVSNTFHGRDIFAPVAAWVSKGIDPNEFGDEITDLVVSKSLNPTNISVNEIEGEIIHIDRFGNLITNFKKENLEKEFTVEINGKIINSQQNFYAEAAPDELFSIWGSAGYLEIAANCNSARDLLNVKNGEKVIIRIS